MKVLICGLGSIGQRHVRNIKQLFGEKVKIAAYRSRNKKIVINDDMTAREGSCPVEHYGIEVFYDLNKALDSGVDIVFVTNPISMHLEVAVLAAKKGKHLFIEKPVADSTRNIDALVSEVNNHQLTTFVAYQLRFHPAVKKIKALLVGGDMGKVVYSNLHFGEWLPGMHPYENYRISHAARQDEGGGATLCLSHEVDLARHFFGEPTSVYATGIKVSDLELDVEDAVTAQLTFNDGDQDFPVTIHLNFIQSPPQRFCNIVCVQGRIFWDYYKSEVLVERPDQKPVVFKFDHYARNEMFLEELRHFFSCVEKKEETIIPLNDGVKTLVLCENIKFSFNRSAQQLAGEESVAR